MSPCESTAPSRYGKWLCTLDAGHPGRHEAHGARPLPVWDDNGQVERLDVGAGIGLPSLSRSEPKNSLPAIKLNTIIAGLQDGIEYRLDRYAFCADCVKSIGGWCADHEEDHAAAQSYAEVIRLLEAQPVLEDR